MQWQISEPLVFPTTGFLFATPWRLRLDNTVAAPHRIDVPATERLTEKAVTAEL